MGDNITNDDRFDIYLEFIESCRNKDVESGEKHHIIPKSYGGSNDDSNIVLLSYQDHYNAHKLLSELFPLEQKLQYAFWCMCTLSRRNRVTTVEDYAYARYMHSLYLSQEFVPWNKGKHLSEEMKRKISEGGMGLRRSDETRKKISKANKGKTLSEDTKQKISKNHADVSGKNNPMYGVPSPATGTRFQWINDGSQNKRWSLDVDIPIGYEKGFIRKGA